MQNTAAEAPPRLLTHVGDMRRNQKRPREESKQEAEQPPLQANQLSSRLRTWTDRALDRISDRERPGPTPDRSSHGDTGDADPDPRVYADWTSKQLRKKCSYLKLRGLKNVKKHVMVEALNRYYRTQVLLNQRVEGTASPMSFSWVDNNGCGSGSGGDRSRASSSSGGSNSSTRSETPPRHGGGDRDGLWPRSSSLVRQLVPSHRVATTHRSLSPDNLVAVDRQGQPLAIGSVNGGNEEPDKLLMLSDIKRLINVMLSAPFVTRLEHELSRWQFWVDVRDDYVATLRQREATAYSSGSPPSSSESLRHRLQQSPRRRTPLWNAMQLWEIWQELTLAYTRTCFHFTSNGAQEGEFVKFCDGRLDVYYLHQRLHEHPELLYLVKSSDYLSSASDDSDDNPEPRAPIPTQQQYLNDSATSESVAPQSSSSGVSSSAATAAAVNANPSGPRRQHASSHSSNSTSGGGGGQPSSGDASSGSDPNAPTSDETDEATDDQMNAVYNEACAQQRYLALLLANFDRTTERLHESHVALLELRDAGNGTLPPPPELVVSELEADVRMLTALKAQLRERLVQTLGG